MPAPTDRLLLYVAVLGIPAFTVMGMIEAPVTVLLGILVFILLLLALDAPSAFGSIAHIKVEMPTLIRTTKARDFEIVGVVINPATACRFVMAGLPCPEGLQLEEAILSLHLRKDTERNRVRWKFKALERGSYSLGECYIGGLSRLGLWSARRVLRCNIEIRVYPDLSRERHVLAPLFFRRGALGVHQIRQIGKGREFEQLRAYVPGDSYDDIYWKGTAKRRYPVTRMFQLERTQEMYVVVDASRRSARRLEQLSQDQTVGIIAKNQLERFIQAALVLALAAEQQQDKCGLVVFSDQVHRLIPAGGGRHHYDTIRDVLYALQPRVVSPDYEDVFIHIGNRLRHRALFIFLTDLGEPWLAESFTEGVKLIARRHVVLAHMLGQKEMRPMFTKNDVAETDDDLYGKLAGQVLWNDLQETTRMLKQRGVHLTASLQENLVADVVNEYLRVKKRQLL
jgi:uncharacterized protein (DUF58 family)